MTRVLQLFGIFFTATLVVALAFDQSQAGCRKNSNQMPAKKMGDMKDMDDMPMCCKMKMDHQKMKGHKAEDKGEASLTVELSDPMAEGKQGKKTKAEEVKDPVCLMTVDPKTAEKSVYKGKNYYFCSKEDTATFEKAPEKYVK